MRLKEYDIQELHLIEDLSVDPYLVWLFKSSTSCLHFHSVRLVLFKKKREKQLTQQSKNKQNKQACDPKAQSARPSVI